ncbi:ABC transporter ATP-binding protein [Pasteurellaceae bacterium HPA106]|uniref:ATP-binding cassette domain-containing protein n=1 Tax=Spirabiliibacterium pneumoniae TaxID=221400 RepID=UPI001AAC7B87|nr:ABC transporter ATP-binding protein [Spirabiliibacterium pneumoniae]MBE2896922.1 ABC transporter ATP-binding protein [Spirabiliibacterium pneumoniae]
MNDTALSLERVSFGYSSAPLLFQALSFDVLSREILAILGPNGCGKSTLPSLLLGHLKPISGKVFSAVKLGFVPQFFTATFDYSVLDIVLMGRAGHIRTFAHTRACHYKCG